MTTKIAGETGEWTVEHVESGRTINTGCMVDDAWRESPDKFTNSWRDWQGSSHNTFHYKRDAKAFMDAIMADDVLPNHEMTLAEVREYKSWLIRMLSSQAI